MGLLDRIFPKRETPAPVETAVADSPAETKDVRLNFVSNGSDYHWIQDPYGLRGESETVTRHTAIAVSAYAYAAIRYRYQNIAEPPLAIQRKEEDGWSFIDGRHPLDVPFMSPNPDHDMADVIELTQAWLDIDGRAIWKKERNAGGMVVGFVPFSGQEIVEIRPSDTAVLGQFVVDVGGGRAIWDASEVVYFRYPDPRDRCGGLAPLDVAMSYLNLDSRVRWAVRQYLRKALFPGGVISPDPAWRPSDDEFKRWKRAIKAHHAGAQNAGEPLAVAGGTKFSATTLPLKDLVPAVLLDRVESVVASVFGIHPVILGYEVGLKNSPWSQMGEGRQYTYQDTLQPIWRRLGRTISRQCIEPVDRVRTRVTFDTREVAALQEDEGTRAAVSKLNEDTWTVNERRAHTGKDPLPEDDPRGELIIGIDRPKMPAQLMDGEDGEEEDDPPPDPRQNQPEEEDDDDES